MKIMEKQLRNGLYTLETLSLLNVPQNEYYGVTMEDVQKVNQLMDFIQKTRSQTTPKEGDLLIYTSKDGSYVHNALVGSFTPLGLNVAVRPFIPFVTPVKDGIDCKVKYFTSTYIPVEKIKYVGKDDRIFKIWGHRGVCEMYFQAEVSVWEYSEPDPLFGDFTTKNWRRLFFYKMDEGENCIYKGDFVTFQNQEAFDNYVKTYHGTVFKGRSENDIILWCYQDVVKEIPLEEWNKLKAPTQVRNIWGVPITVKMCKNDANHQIISLMPQFSSKTSASNQ